MKSSIRIRSAKPKMKSPFIKEQKAFPKDFFSHEDPVPQRKSIENNRINSTFDSNVQSLNNTMTSNQKNGSRKESKKNFSKIFRSKSRKYTKSTNLFSEKRKHPIRINGLVNLDVLKKDNNSTIQQNLEVYSKANKVFKLSRNSSGLNSNQINDNSVTIESRKCPSSNLNNTQEVSASLLGVADPLQREDNSDIRRPVIKSKFQNYVRNSSNKSLLSFDANLKINLGDLAKERLKICKNNDFKIPNQRCSELKLAYRQKTSSSNYSSIYKTVDNDCGRNNSSMSSQYYGAKHKVL